MSKARIVNVEITHKKINILFEFSSQKWTRFLRSNRLLVHILCIKNEYFSWSKFCIKNTVGVQSWKAAHLPTLEIRVKQRRGPAYTSPLLPHTPAPPPLLPRLHLTPSQTFSSTPRPRLTLPHFLHARDTPSPPRPPLTPRPPLNHTSLQPTSHPQARQPLVFLFTIMIQIWWQNLSWSKRSTKSHFQAVPRHVQLRYLTSFDRRSSVASQPRLLHSQLSKSTSVNTKTASEFEFIVKQNFFINEISWFLEVEKNHEILLIKFFCLTINSNSDAIFVFTEVDLDNRILIRGRNSDLEFSTSSTARPKLWRPGGKKWEENFGPKNGMWPRGRPPQPW